MEITVHRTWKLRPVCVGSTGPFLIHYAMLNVPTAGLHVWGAEGWIGLFSSDH